MGMVSEWTFTKKGRNTEAEVTRTFVDEELSDKDRKELEELFVYLIDLYKLRTKNKIEEVEGY